MNGLIDSGESDGTGSQSAAARIGIIDVHRGREVRQPRTGIARPSPAAEQRSDSARCGRFAHSRRRILLSGSVGHPAPSGSRRRIAQHQFGRFDRSRSVPAERGPSDGPSQLQHPRLPPACRPPAAAVHR